MLPRLSLLWFVVLQIVELLAAGSAAAVKSDAAEVACPADGGCSPAPGTGRRHHWPNVRGHVGSYGISDVALPLDRLGKPSWRWTHPRGQYGTIVVGGPVIDDEKNLYFVEMKAVYKMSPDGLVLWTQEPDPQWEAAFPDGPSIMGDRVYVSTTKGQLCSYDMATGRLVWAKKFYAETGGDSKYVTSHDGVVIIGTDNAYHSGGGSRHVVAADGITGNLLWDFSPDTPTWNNMGMFTDDGRVVFQDWDSRVYCLGLHNGTLLWKSGGMTPQPWAFPPYSNTWTDGGTIIGADGVVYAVSSKAIAEMQTVGGGVHAYRLSDGALLWERPLSWAFLTWPVAARLDGDPEFTLFAFPGAGPSIPWHIEAAIQFMRWSPTVFGACVCLGCCHLFLYPAGVARRKRKRILCGWLAVAILAPLFVTYVNVEQWRRAQNPKPSAMVAYDAKTGNEKWNYRLPDWPETAARGDKEGFLQRVLGDLPNRPICLPVAFSSPSVDGNSTVWIGTQSGIFYGVKDANRDGVIGPSEVSTFDAEASFLHSGPAFAPGMFAFTTCDSLFVWRF